MTLTRALVPLLIVAAIAVAVTIAASPPERARPPALPADADELDSIVAEVDGFFVDQWRSAELEPADGASELGVLRRLSLALHGTIPSLEEIRTFEADEQPRKIERWTEHLLRDSRFADYFAERLARALVGTEEGQFVIYRRDRFTNWLRERLTEGTPFDAVVRQTISESGLWTDHPAANFVTSAYANDELDENQLAGRAVRAFLGQRMDCAQCHDHPFEQWKQQDFEGLAAYFGQTGISLVGVEDKTSRHYEVEDAQTLETRRVEPRVPFHPEWLPAQGSLREKLAAWITHPENRRFERATVNRVWGLLFGKAYLEPVDDLPDPGDGGEPDVLDILGRDFREHGYDLRRLIRVIAASRPFGLSSRHALESTHQMDLLEQNWAVFPLVRLRPEQVIGALLQAASIKTVDQNTHVLFRAIKYTRTNDFVEEYGDAGMAELEERTGTIPQALLRMNGKLVSEVIEAGPLSASGRISGLAATDERRVETCFLVCLSRRPTDEEHAFFVDHLQAAGDEHRGQAVEDIFWSLFNSPEFSWNH